MAPPILTDKKFYIRTYVIFNIYISENLRFSFIKLYVCDLFYLYLKNLCHNESLCLYSGVIIHDIYMKNKNILIYLFVIKMGHNRINNKWLFLGKQILSMMMK